jgi:hypothetical protein
MEDGRPHASEEVEKLEEAEEIAPGVEPASHLSKLDEADVSPARSLVQGPRPVRRNGDVEVLGECGEQRRDVCLRAANLRERDRDEDARPVTSAAARTPRGPAALPASPPNYPPKP